MSITRNEKLVDGAINDHCFSADGNSLAIASNCEVKLFQNSGTRYSLENTLQGHDKVITGIDIAAKSGQIVTCSQDRNAYVWDKTASGWKPTLVLLRINRAATCVRWSPSEKKFAVGSGARIIAICYFEEENDWWVSKHIKKPIKSTVCDLAWHPNSVLLAVGATDARARVFSAFIKGVDEKPDSCPWGDRFPFNTVCADVASPYAGWIRCCEFSPSGDALAFASQDSTITVVYPQGPELPPRAVTTISTQLLPFTSLLWNGEKEIIVAGFDCEPYRFVENSSGWQLVGPIGSKGQTTVASAMQESALNMFKQMDLRGANEKTSTLNTVHQNTILTLRSHSLAERQIKQLSSTGMDGRVVLWSL